MADVVGVEALGDSGRRGHSCVDGAGARSGDLRLAVALVVGGRGGGGRRWGPAAAAVKGLARERGGEASRHDHGTEVAVTSSKMMELELEVVRKEKRRSFVRLSCSSSSSSTSLSAVPQTCSISHRFLVMKFLAQMFSQLLNLWPRLLLPCMD